MFAANEPLQVEEVELAEPGPGEARVRIEAAGVCHSDLHWMLGHASTPLPVVLGHEGCGIVEAVGEGVTSVSAGDRCVFILRPNCGRCDFCTVGRPMLCDGRTNPDGTLFDGTTRIRRLNGDQVYHYGRISCFAEHAVLPEEQLLVAGDDIPADRAALVGCAVTTGVGAVFNTAKVQPGSTVAVFGCGGVGLNVIQGARIAGAQRIIAVDISDEKLAMARKFGATDVIKGTDDPSKALKKLTGGGPDYAFECVGSGELAAAAYRAIRRGGLAVVVGVAKPGDSTSVRTMTLPFEEKTLTGSYFGSCVPRVDFPRMLDLYTGGRLMLDELITRRYPVAEAPQAFADLESGRNARGVIVFS